MSEAHRDEFTLTDLLGHERRALAGLLGRRTVAAGSMRIRRSELDAALERAGIAVTLREALEFLDGPLSDRRADRVAREHAWSAALSLTAEPRLAALLTDATGTALVKRLSGSDPARAELLLAQAACVLGRLPGHGISRAQLAAEVLGDSHSLETDARRNHRVAGVGRQNVYQRHRSGWITGRRRICPATVGLVWVSRSMSWHSQRYVSTSRVWTSTARICPRASQYTYRCAPCYAAPHLACGPTRRVRLQLPVTSLTIRRNRLGAACAPLACTDGMPSAAQQSLLAQLAAAGARLRYHGDFDWAGLVIGNFVMREFGAKSWRFGVADYLFGDRKPESRCTATSNLSWRDGTIASAAQYRSGESSCMKRVWLKL